MMDNYKYKSNNISTNKTTNLQEIKEEHYSLNYPSAISKNNNINNSNDFLSNDRYGDQTFSSNNNDTVLQSTNPKNKSPVSLKYSILRSSSSNFLSKVIIENIPSPQKAISLLENFLSQNNYENINYQKIEGEEKIEFIFNDEQVAFNFTKLIHQQKERSPSFYNVNVHLSLVPNNNYGRGRCSSLKKKGLPIASIQRLFQGLGVTSKNKEEKKMNKINGNLDLGVSSPFLYPHERKKMKKDNKKCETEGNVLKGKNSGNNEFINKFKDYTRLPIRVLDTHYCPLSDPNFRPEEKNKWVSPSNFKY